MSQQDTTERLLLVAENAYLKAAGWEPVGRLAGGFHQWKKPALWTIFSHDDAMFSQRWADNHSS